MRAPLLFAVLGLACCACQGRSAATVDDGAVDAGAPSDAGPPPDDAGSHDAGTVIDAGAVSCVDSPNDLPRPTSTLPCDLVPPGL